MSIRKISATGFDCNNKAYKYHFPENKIAAFESYAITHQFARNGVSEKPPFTYVNYYYKGVFIRRVWFKQFGKYKTQ